MLTTKTGREVLEGALERIDKTMVQPLKKLITSKGGLPISSTTTFANPMKGQEQVRQLTKIPEMAWSAAKETASDYGNMITEAFTGNKKALGAAAMFFLPFDEIRFGGML